MLFFSAVQETSIANATIIGALQPLLMLAVAGPLFGERPAVDRRAWGLVAVGGAAIVVLGGDGGGANSADGDLLAVGALVAWTAYFVSTKTARTQLTSFEYLTGHGDRVGRARHPGAVPARASRSGSPTGEAGC